MVNASPFPTIDNIDTNIDRPHVGATHSHRKMGKLGINIDGECVALPHNGQHQHKHRSR